MKKQESQNKKNEIEQIPLSRHAQSRLSENWESCWTLALVATFLGTFFIPLVAAGTESIKVLLYGSTIILLIWMLSYLIGGRRWQKNRQHIIEQNKADYRQSQRLKQGLEKFSAVKSSNFPVTEEKISGKWKPFRIEHFISNSLRGEITGQITLRGGGLLASTYRGTMRGSVKGIALPNLLDSSSILFFKDGNKTLRVLLPSPRATRELLIKTLEIWMKKKPRFTHCYNVLDEYAISDQDLLHPISHPQLIDSLDASCELSGKQRPKVEVRGELIQPGVVLATALDVGGKQSVFLPSGFFRALTNQVVPFIEQAKKPKIIETVKEG